MNRLEIAADIRPEISARILHRSFVSSLLQMCTMLGRTPDNAATDRMGRPVTISQMARQVNGGEVHDLTMDEAVEFAREWPFSAQQIFDGFKRDPR